MPKLEVVNANNVIEFNPQKANFKLKNTGGPKGEPGAQGPKGDTGPQGPAGPQGIQGEKGDKGAQGERGPQGIQGPQGPQGIQGPKGDKGDKGNTGATGPQGPQGPAGQNGTDGQDGADGFSPIATVTQEGLDAEISITDKNGTTTATVPGFGVQVVESLPATGSSNVIYLERDSNSASGNPISIADAVQAPLKSLEIQGNTTQQTYTGKNLLKMPIVSGSSNGITWTVQDDGSIILNGTSTAGVNIRANNVTIPAVGGETYTLSATGMGEAYNFGYKNSGSGTNIFVVTSTSPTTTAVVTSTMLSQANCLDMYIQSGKTFNNQRVTLLLEKGSSASSFEPYVGGTASPNPDYPQTVNTVTGENVVKICGKNLWGAEEHGSINENTGEDAWNANRWRTVGYIPVESNTAYTLSSNASADIWYIFCFYDSSKNFISGVAVYGGSQTQTTPANCEFMRCVVCDTASIKTTERQLELGSSASSFEPYQEQSYEVDLASKNLFDATNANTRTGYILNNSGVEVSDNTGGYTRNYSRVLPSTTYTISGLINAGTRRVYYYDQNKNFISRSDGSGASSWQFITPANCYFVNVQIYTNTDNSTSMASWQIEKGSSASQFESFWQIELCEIGTYQDYIYKNGTDWKIHKVVSHDIFNWDVNGIAANNTSGTTVVSAEGAFSVFFLSGSISNSDRPNMRLSENIGTYNSSQQIYANGEARAMTDGTFKPRDMSGTVDRFYFRNTAYIGKTGNEVKNILVEKTGGIGLWWFFTTPTDTTITNAALIAQLEAILAGGTQAGANTITLTPSAGATGTLEVEYYDSYDSYLWVNNRWEKFAHLG